MKRLQLNDAEKEVLADTLESSLSRLGDEISHTDSYDYRELLKDRKVILARLREKLH